MNETKALVGLVDDQIVNARKAFLAELKGTSLAVAEFGVELKKRGRRSGLTPVMYCSFPTTVQQTVDFHRYSSLDGCGCACCAMTGALVVPRRKLWSLRRCSGFGRRSVLGQGCCARWCNDWGPRNAWFDYGYMFCIIQDGFWNYLYVTGCLGS